MNVPAKALIGLGAIGTVGGASYAISTQFATENISKKLRDKGYQILKDYDGEWTPILANYLKSSKLKFKDFDGKVGGIAKLKEECKKALDSPSADNDSYEKAKHWCTVPRDLKTLLKASKYKALNTSEDDNNEDKDKWDKKLDLYVKNEAQFANKKFNDDAKIKFESAGKQKSHRDAIKEKCKALENKKHYEVDFETNLEKSKLWCAIDETAST